MRLRVDEGGEGPELPQIRQGHRRGGAAVDVDALERGEGQGLRRGDHRLDPGRGDGELLERVQFAERDRAIADHGVQQGGEGVGVPLDDAQLRRDVPHARAGEMGLGVDEVAGEHGRAATEKGEEGMPPVRGVDGGGDALHRDVLAEDLERSTGPAAGAFAYGAGDHLVPREDAVGVTRIGDPGEGQEDVACRPAQSVGGDAACERGPQAVGVGAVVEGERRPGPGRGGCECGNGSSRRRRHRGGWGAISRACSSAS